MKHVVFFARQPKLGCVKTRLAREIGPVETLRFYRSTLTSVIRRAAAGQSWQTWVSLTPDKADIDHRIFPTKVGRLLQGRGNLGDRMARCFSGFGQNPVLIIGSDIPGVGQAHIAAAFGALRRNDVVFGPSYDGGYWLVGIRKGKLAGALFDNVRWSTEYALSDTRENLSPSFRVAMLEMLADIDSGSDYAAWRHTRV